MEYYVLFVCMLSCLWTVAHQAPLSMEFSRQEYRSGFPFPPPRELPDLGIPFKSLASPALAGEFFSTVQPEYYSAIKWNKTVPFAERWVDLETVTQSEVSSSLKNECYGMGRDPTINEM